MHRNLSLTIESDSIQTEDKASKGTTIHLSFQRKIQLDGMKIIPRESYDNILLRLIEDHRKHHRTRDPVDLPAEKVEHMKQEA